MKLEIGQKLYYSEYNRWDKTTTIKHRVIGSIGRKYLYFDDDKYKRDKIDIETLRNVSEYSRKYMQYYLTDQDIHDIKERGNLFIKIRDAIRYDDTRKITLDHLREIARILNIIA